MYLHHCILHNNDIVTTDGCHYFNIWPHIFMQNCTLITVLYLIINTLHFIEHPTKI